MIEPNDWVYEKVLMFFTLCYGLVKNCFTNKNIDL